MKLLEKRLTNKLRKFRMVFKFFWFCLTLLVQKKFKNSIFEITIIPQTLNVNNLRTTIAKFINLVIFTELIKYSGSVRVMFTLTVFQILLLEGRLVFAPAQRDTGSERVKFSVKKKQENVQLLSKLLAKWLTYKLKFRSHPPPTLLILFNPFSTGKKNN